MKSTQGGRGGGVMLMLLRIEGEVGVWTGVGASVLFSAGEECMEEP